MLRIIIIWRGNDDLVTVAWIFWRIGKQENGSGKYEGCLMKRRSWGGKRETGSKKRWESGTVKHEAESKKQEVRTSGKQKVAGCMKCETSDRKLEPAGCKWGAGSKKQEVGTSKV